MHWVLFCLALVAGSTAAQPNGILLVAKPEMRDPNFRETVIAVTRAPDASTVGVILNRPTGQRHGEHALYDGGPVMKPVLVAMFAANSAPTDAAFPMLPGIYLSMHPRNIEMLSARRGARVKFFAGFSGWAPRQLEAEMAGGSWYALRATDAVLFRTDTSTMWRELVEQANRPRTILRR